MHVRLDHRQELRNIGVLAGVEVSLRDNQLGFLYRGFNKLDSR